MEPDPKPSLSTFSRKKNPSNASPTIPKWPFLVSDLLLMGSALWVAIFFSSNLSPTLVAVFILAVLLGAIIFSAPFLMEHWMLQQQTRLKQARAEETLLSAIEQSEDLLSRCKEVQQEVMKGVIVVRQAPQKMEDISEQLSALMNKAEVNLIQPARNVANSLESSNIEAWQAKLEQMLQSLGALQSRLVEKEEPSQNLIDLSPILQDLNEISQKLDKQQNLIAHFPTSAIDNSTLSSEESEPPEEKPEREEDDRAAVSKVKDINKEADLDISTKTEATASKTPEPPASQEPLSNPTPNPELKESPGGGTDSEPLDFSVIKSEFDEKGPKKKSAKRKKAADENEPELMFGDDPIKTEQLLNNQETRVVVDAFIGVSNKLFIRGDAPGLSWEKGIPMELVGIGKWEWKTEKATKAFKCRVYINDESDMDSSEFKVSPKQVFTTTASF